MAFFEVVKSSDSPFSFRMIGWNTLHLELFQHLRWIMKLFLELICMCAPMRLSQIDPGNELFDTFSKHLSFGLNGFHQITFENELGKHKRKTYKINKISEFWL